MHIQSIMKPSTKKIAIWQYFKKVMQYHSTFATSKELHNCLGENRISRSIHVFVFKLFLSFKCFNSVVFLQQNAAIIAIKERSKIACIGCLRQLHSSPEFYKPMFYNSLFIDQTEWIFWKQQESYCLMLVFQKIVSTNVDTISSHY